MYVCMYYCRYDNMQTKLSHNFFEDDLVMQLLNECKDEVFEEETRKKVPYSIVEKTFSYGVGSG